MRILILADIHSNWAALRAVQEPYDVCLVVGDLVDYGPQPGECIRWVQQHALACVRGNHDHAVAQRACTNGRNGLKYLSGVTRELSWRKLAAKQINYLASLPVTRPLTLADRRFLLVHGTPRDPLDEYAANDPNFWARRLERVEADVICVGHTHQPYVLNVGNKMVINPGSVGQPRDGSPAASYAIWEDGRVELKRIPYPVEETLEALEQTDLPESAKRMAMEILRTGGGCLKD